MSITMRPLREEKGSNKASLDIWIEAYNKLRRGGTEEDMTLMLDYEKALDHLMPGTKSGIRKLLRDGDSNALANIITGALAPAKAKHAKHESRDAKIEEAVKFASKIKDTISQVVQPFPPAALAWAGLCAVAPFVATAWTQNKQMWIQLDQVLDNLQWYMSRDQVLFDERWKRSESFMGLQRHLRGYVVKLYKALIRYQICVVNQVAPQSIFGVVGDYTMRAVGLLSWTERFAEIQKLEKEVKARTLDVHQIEVVDLLRPVASEASTIRQVLTAAQQDKDKVLVQEYIGKFAVMDYHAGMTRNAVLIKGTCVWFANHSNFEAWLRSTDQILLVTADPGCGKSVLSRFLAERFFPACGNSSGKRPSELPEAFVKHEEYVLPATIVLYFFFNESQTQSRRVATALSSVIHQILTKKQNLVRLIQEKINSAGNDLQNNVSCLWDILLTLITNLSDGRVVMIFDALDECNSSELQDFASRLTTLKNYTNVKVMLTTRGYTTILAQFRELNTLAVHLGGDSTESCQQIHEEIGVVMEYRLKRLCESNDLSQDVQKSLKQWLVHSGGQQQKQRSYLWVNLVFNALEEKGPAGIAERFKLISSVPPTLSHAYETFSDRISPIDKPNVRVLLQLVLAAYQPLSLQEAQIAIRVRDKIGAKSEAHLDLMPDHEFQQWIHSSCGFMLTVYDDHIYLVHQTCRDFLLRPKDSGQGDPPTESHWSNDGSWQHSMTEHETHATMAESCIAYLSLRHFKGTFFTKMIENIFPPGLYSVKYGRRHGRKSSVFSGPMKGHRLTNLGAIANKYKFLLYTCTHWLQHFRLAQSFIEGELQPTVGAPYHAAYLSLFDGDNLSVHPWFRVTIDILLDVHSDRLRHVLSEVICMEEAKDIAAYFNHVELLQKRLSGPAMDSVSKPDTILHFSTTLSWAAIGGSTECVKYLSGTIWFEELTLPAFDHTPLSLAAHRGHIETLEALIEGGCNINQKNFKGENAVLKTLATCADHYSKLSFDSYTRDRIRQAIRLMVTKGGNVRDATSNGNTALHYLVYIPNGMDEIDPTGQSTIYDYRNLFEAADTQRADTKESYDRAQAMRGDTGKRMMPSLRYCLHPTTFFEEEYFLDLYDDSLMKFLIDNHAPLDMPNHNHRETPLHIAAQLLWPASSLESMHPWSILFLIHAGADISVRNWDGLTAFQCAQRRGNGIAGLALRVASARAAT